MKTSQKKLKILKVKNDESKNEIKIPLLFDVPFRLIISAKSGQGKSNFLANMFLNTNFPYHKIFKGSHIIMFAPNPMADKKLRLIVEELDVPESNLFQDIDFLGDVYESLIEDYLEREEEEEKVENAVIIVDDFAFSGSLASRFGDLAKVYNNGRKFNISVITLTQAYSQLAKNIRNQATGFVLFNTNNRELELIESENNFLSGGKKQFFKMWRDNVKEKHDFMIVNYSNPAKSLYLNKDFEVINS